MNTVQLLGLPTFCFAHIHSAEKYHHNMTTNHTRLEVSYITEGSLNLSVDKQHFVLEKGDIICSNLQPISLDVDSFHCHHTVCALVDWQTALGLNHLLLPTVTKASSHTEKIKELIDEFIYNGYLYEDSPEKNVSLFLNILCKIDTCNRNSGIQGMNTTPPVIF